MIINLKKSQGVLVPSLPVDEEKLSRWKFGDILACEVRKPRNAKFHRKFYALMNVVFDNQDKYDKFKDFIREIKLKTGVYDEHITTKGEIVYIPGSIAFHNMDDMEFEKFYSDAIDVVLKHFIPTTREDTDKMVQEVLSYA